jgi:RNA polymerase sigma-70 factor (ECF subfamily)
MSTEKIDFRKLFELHGQALRRALRRYGGRAMPVEDGLQQVFEIAVRKHDEIAQADACLLKTWLLKTAFHVAQNWRREAQHAREVAGLEPDGEGLDAEAEDSASPEYWFTLSETRRDIHATIDTLPEALREVFVLAEIENMPLAKIAAALNLPLRTVRDRLDRARHAFLKEGNRRRAAGLLGVVAVLQDTAESRSRAEANRWLQNAGWALFGGAVVAALFYLTRPAPVQIPIHAEPPQPAVIADTRSILVPGPAVLDPPQPPPPLVPALPQPLPADPDDSLRDQLTLTDTATQRIDEGRYHDALQLLERHRSLYPDGPTAEERDRLIRRAKHFIAAGAVGLATKGNH